MLRIITGKFKGRKLKLPKGIDTTRPTSDRTKEGMFNIIEARNTFKGAAVLDLFAGTGNLGLEALSRGAKNVVFVDSNRACIEAVKSNATSLGLKDEYKVIPSDVIRFLQGIDTPYDFVFCDPPYDLPEMVDMVELILQKNWLKEDGWFILEHDVRHDFSQHPHCVFSKPYGRTIVTIFLKQPVLSTEE